jgi:energy-coupling factor transporter ATP-binding protein EcfA2
MHFFGQDKALGKAMLQLTENAEARSPFLLVLGASGSGKSSLVKAGILPKLFVPRRVPGAAFLRRIVFRPSDVRDGEDLFDALARMLTTQVGDEEGLSELIGPGQSLAGLAAHLRNATAEPAYPIGTALGQLALQARQHGRMLEYESARLVLVVDQLEELFTVDRITSDERWRFVDLLAGLARSGLVWVVATMRIEFWHRAHEAPELVRLSEGQMIRRPAAAAEHAHDEDWPDEAWRNWRYRRATLARLLAREGMMQQVAEAYIAARDKRTSHTSTLREEIEAKFHL